jgi:hypothetical protein
MAHLGGIGPGRCAEEQHMYHLYGSKTGVPKKLVATFDSEPQLLAYVRWAILSERDGVYKFEKGSSLASYHGFSYASELLTGDDPEAVDHNPSPSML